MTPFLPFISLLMLLGMCITYRGPVHNGARQGQPGDSLRGASGAYRQIAAQKLGENVVYRMNENKQWVLCTKDEKPGPAPMANAIHFLVIDLKSHAVLHEGRIANGKVDWYDDTHLKISRFRETVQIGQKTLNDFYLYDLINRKELPPPSSNL